jgi:competence protein ComEC
VVFDARQLYLPIAALAVLCLIALYRDARELAAACCFVAMLLAGVLVSIANQMPPAPELDAEDQAPVILAGCVVEPAILANDREQFTLELEAGARARINLYVKEGETAPELRYGQKIEMDAKVRRPHNYQNPGSFDYVHFLARQKIFWTASGSVAGVHVVPGRCGSPFMAAIFALRTAALARIETLYQGQPYNIGMMQAVLIGESSKLDKVWTEEYRSTGTFHALVISGSHVAVLAAFFLFLLRICFVPRRTAMLFTIAAAWIYALVTGWQAPVIRSAAGMTLFAIGKLVYRQGRILNLIAAVALFFVVLDPEQLFDASFQLSFLSVGLIAAFVIPLIERTSGPLAHGLKDLGNRDRDLHLPPRAAQFRIEIRLLASTLSLLTRLPLKISEAAAGIGARVLLFFYELVLTSAVIQVGLALPMAIYFHRVSFSGLSANAIVVPLLGIVVPVGFLAVFTGWHWIAQIAGGLLALSQHTVNFHARLEPNWRIPAPPIWLSIAFSAALILAAIRFAWKWFRSAAVLVAFTLLVVLVWHPFAPVVARGVLEMTAIDVGQGDSLLVAFPNGKLMLIDGGGIPSFGRKTKTKLDIGEDVVAPYLWTRSIRRIDIVALSHAHEDHIGGLHAILEDFEVKELWTGATPEYPSWDALRRTAAERHVKVIAMERGRQFDFGGAKIDVLAPGPDYVPSITPKNNDSLVMRIAYGRHSFLLAGDMEKQIEGDLVAQNLAQHADVLKVGHHGSKTSSTTAFLDAVHPAFAVMSVGFENSYGHPHRQTLANLADRGIEVLRTDRSGLISICTDGQRIWTSTPHLNQ